MPVVVERIAIVMSTVCNANSPRLSVSLHAGLKMKRRGGEEEEEDEKNCLAVFPLHVLY